MKPLLRALLALGVVLGFGLATAPSAIAHVPSGSASCSGAVVSVHSYSNPVTIHVEVAGGGSETKTVTGSGSVTASVPQDGEAHGWSGYAHGTGGENSQEYSGQVGPCGEKPPPPTTTPTPTPTPTPSVTPTPTPKPTPTPQPPTTTPSHPHQSLAPPPKAPKPPNPPAQVAQPPAGPVDTGYVGPVAKKLPNTGQKENLTLTAAAGIVLLTAGGFLLYRRRLS